MAAKRLSIFQRNVSFFSRNSKAIVKTDPVIKGNLSLPRTVPSHIMRPEYAETGEIEQAPQKIYLHDQQTIPIMRHCGKIARTVLEYAYGLAKPGVTTDEIDEAVHNAIIKLGAYPAPLNFAGFPKSVCSSVNEVACHGIPDDRKLKDGDVLSLDVSIYFEGFFGDNCGTICVGDMTGREHLIQLVDATKEAVDTAVQVVKPGACLSQIGDAIDRVSKKYGYSTVTQVGGHGLGHKMHLLPFVQHAKNRYRLNLVEGMCFTIEPILVEGNPALIKWSDGWTLATKDFGNAAQFEHAVLVTHDGCEVLTVVDQNLLDCILKN